MSLPLSLFFILTFILLCSSVWQGSYYIARLTLSSRQSSRLSLLRFGITGQHTHLGVCLISWDIFCTRVSLLTFTVIFAVSRVEVFKCTFRNLLQSDSLTAWSRLFALPLLISLLTGRPAASHYGFLHPSTPWEAAQRLQTWQQFMLLLIWKNVVDVPRPWSWVSMGSVSKLLTKLSAWAQTHTSLWAERALSSPTVMPRGLAARDHLFSPGGNHLIPSTVTGGWGSGADCVGRDDGRGSYCLCRTALFENSKCVRLQCLKWEMALAFNNFLGLLRNNSNYK